MAKYVCTICGFVYDEAKGYPEAGIAPGTKWEDVPDDWQCPLCGAVKSDFERQGAPVVAKVISKEPKVASQVHSDDRRLSALETSILCRNLALGCEKQYKKEEAALFTELADYFAAKTGPALEPSFEKLIALIDKDLEEGYPLANQVARADEDRGALRALTWSIKVTKILKSLLTRYEKLGDKMLENTGVYVCTICGFIYIGDDLPEICPVCKVPNWKFEQVKEGNAIG